jgi:hypothetical protein
MENWRNIQQDVWGASAKDQTFDERCILTERVLVV